MTTAPYGPLRIGRLTLTEDWDLTQKSGGASRGITLSGQEAVTGVASPDQRELRSRAEGLLAYDGAIVPVVFNAFPHFTGWYQVSSPSAEEMTWYDQTFIEWQCDLTRVGRGSEIELESRLIGGNRSHTSTAVAELWHAPAIGSDSYYVGANTPGYVDRTSADGVVRIYRGLPAAVDPRWSSDPDNYLAGAVSASIGSTILTGLTCEDTPSDWVLSNGLLTVTPQPSGGTIAVTSYLSSKWGTPKVFNIKRDYQALGTPKHITVLRNDPCEAVIRLSWDSATGRTTADLSLKRGSRFLSIYIQQSVASNQLGVDEAGSSATSNQLTASGYIVQTTNDVDGNRWMLGAPLLSNTAGIGVLDCYRSAVTRDFSAYIGCVRAGGSAVSGDTAAQINAQYLGSPTESERVVRR